MIKVHVISDLYLGFNEMAPEEHILPDVDLVVINGNIGHIKRSMLYAETLCRQYPNIKFIVNLGETERYRTIDKHKNEVEDQLHFRKRNNNTWPPNLYWDTEPMIIDLGKGRKIDVLCLYGFPKIHNYIGDWKDTVWYRNYPMLGEDSKDLKDTIFKPDETSNVRHGYAFQFASMDFINTLHTNEETKARNWELTVTDLTKVLITHINPYIDSRLNGQTVSPYLIHLNEGVWISSNSFSNNVLMNGGRLISNPGRGLEARSYVADVKIF